VRPSFLLNLRGKYSISGQACKEIRPDFSFFSGSFVPSCSAEGYYGPAFSGKVFRLFLLPSRKLLTYHRMKPLLFPRSFLAEPSSAYRGKAALSWHKGTFFAAFCCFCCTDAAKQGQSFRLHRLRLSSAYEKDPGKTGVSSQSFLPQASTSMICFLL